jgi:hypothetical protein
VWSATERRAAAAAPRMKVGAFADMEEGKEDENYVVALGQHCHSRI